jgi:hypothetical protein
LTDCSVVTVEKEMRQTQQRLNCITQRQVSYFLSYPDCWVTYKVFHISEYSLGSRNEIGCSKGDFAGTFLCAVTSYILNLFGHYGDVYFARISLSGTMLAG